MAIQLNRSQIKDNAINSDKLDLTGNQTFDYTAAGITVLVGTPTTGNQAANKTYVDNLANGLYWKDACTVASTTNLLVAGVTADNTLTFNAGGTQAIDGVILTDDMRVLVKDQDSALYNGIYTVTNDGAGATVVLTRSEDANTATELDAAAVFITQGTENADVGFVQTGEIGTLGVDDVDFVQFTGAGALEAGDGIIINGNTVSFDFTSISAQAGGALLYASNTGEFRISVNASGALDSTGSLAVQVDNTTIEINPSNNLAIRSSGITELLIADNAVTLSKIADSSVSLDKVSFGYVHQTENISNGTTNEIEINNAVYKSSYQTAQSFRVARNGQLLRPSAGITVSGTGTFTGTYGTSTAGNTVTLLFDGYLEDGDEIDIVYLN